MIRTRTDKVREILSDEIVSGAVEPGTRLDEATLARRFQVSRTPVREALKQLAISGLVEMRAHRGAEVARITVERIAAMFEAMAEIEALCARLAAERMTPAERRGLERLHAACGDAMRGIDPEGYHDANRVFHAAIHAGSHNPVLIEMARTLRARLSPFSRAQFRGADRLARSYAEHEAVLRAIQRGDSGAAQHAMSGHVTVVRDAFAAYLASRTRPAAGSSARVTAELAAR